MPKQSLSNPLDILECVATDCPDLMRKGSAIVVLYTYLIYTSFTLLLAFKFEFKQSTGWLLQQSLRVSFFIIRAYGDYYL